MQVLHQRLGLRPRLGSAGARDRVAPLVDTRAAAQLLRNDLLQVVSLPLQAADLPFELGDLLVTLRDGFRDIGRFEASVRAGKLRVVLREHEPPALPIHVVYASTRLLSAKVRAFVELVTKTRDWRFVDL